MLKTLIDRGASNRYAGKWSAKIVIVLSLDGSLVTLALELTGAWRALGHEAGPIPRNE